MAGPDRARDPRSTAGMALEGLLGLIMRADAVPGPTQDDPDRGKGPMGGGALRHLPTLSSLMLAGDPGRSSFGEPNQAPEAGVNFQIASGNLTSERTISLKERGGCTCPQRTRDRGAQWTVLEGLHAEWL